MPDTAAEGAPRARLFWSLVAGVVAGDVLTKLVAVDRLSPCHLPQELVGDAVRLTLVRNPGAAFGLHVGPYSRWVFIALTIGALAILWRLFRDTRAGDTARTIALGLVCGGAIGNLVDRLRSPLGVVDFIDVGVGDMRWPTFNVADMAVSTGAILLAWVLWGEDAAAPQATPLATPSAARPVLDRDPS